MSITQRVTEVRSRIAEAARQAGRDPDAVRLIAVTKSQGPEVLSELLAAGVADWGENRIDHLAAMAAAAPPGGRFHGIGRVQGRQLSEYARLASSLHSLCDLDHVARLAKACDQRTAPFPVFVQVNASGEGAKAGVPPEGAGSLCDAVRAQASLQLVGLMTMAPELGPTVPADAVRHCFAMVRAIAEQHGLARLSMGMSGDYELAVAEGATEVRIGTFLFS